MKHASYIFILFVLILDCVVVGSAVHAQEAESTDEVQTTEEQQEPEPIRFIPTVKIYETNTFTPVTEFLPFGQDTEIQGLSVASADMYNNGIDRIIVGAGRGDAPLVRIFNQKGQLQKEFLAYAETFNKGLKVITADLTYDGMPEIIVTPNEGGGPQVRVFNSDGAHLFSFFAFDESLRGGVNVCVGDIDGDYLPEFVAGSGYEMTNQVKILDTDLTEISSFMPYEEDFNDGVNVWCEDIDGDGMSEIVTAPSIGHSPLVKIFDAHANELSQFHAYHPAFWGGVNIAAKDFNNDGTPEIITGAGIGGGPHVRFYDQEGNVKLNPLFFVFDKENFTGGVSVDAMDTDDYVVVGTQHILDPERSKHYKYIEVDLTEQKLYTYYKGAPVKDFYISSGTTKFPTPEGEWNIYAKIENTTMSGWYGEDHPENYDLENVPHVLAYDGDYTIHGAYWHWNFGNRMSHGCINVGLTDAEWLYNWADLNVPIKIYSSGDEE